jgi:hypothetical protein
MSQLFEYLTNLSNLTKLTNLTNLTKYVSSSYSLLPTLLIVPALDNGDNGGNGGNGGNGEKKEIEKTEILEKGVTLDTIQSKEQTCSVEYLSFRFMEFSAEEEGDPIITMHILIERNVSDPSFHLRMCVMKDMYQQDDKEETEETEEMGDTGRGGWMDFYCSAWLKKVFTLKTFHEFENGDCIGISYRQLPRSLSFSHNDNDRATSEISEMFQLDDFQLVLHSTSEDASFSIKNRKYCLDLLDSLGQHEIVRNE